MKVLVACEFSGVVRDAFKIRGHEAWSCDILETEAQGNHIQGRVEELYPLDEWDLVIAHPPCTALCLTGNKHYSGTVERERAVQFVKDLFESGCRRICIENPVGVLSNRFRRPDQYIHPYQFGHPVTKKTGLWLKNLPPLIPTNIVDPDEQVVFSSGKKMSKWYYETSLLPKNQRARARSITFQGIADAMAEQWGA